MIWKPKALLKIGAVKAKINRKVALDATNAPTVLSVAGAGDAGGTAPRPPASA